ncbi:leucine zipper domain-containing protein [Mycobacterium sp.]|uniref:leucine zipper domain-containing protein n=1 Tax=Mycobacterium sp. TaxID=1785 RepID=UPI003F99FD5D
MSRNVFYRWKRRYDDEGLEGLKDRSSAPLYCPTVTDPDVVEKIVDRWERIVLTRAAPIETWIRSQSAQNRATSPARRGPSQNCLCATHMFPEAGTTLSNSIGPPWYSPGFSASAALSCAGPGVTTGASVGGTHSSTRARSVCGVGVNRCCGDTGCLRSRAWCGRSPL